MGTGLAKRVEIREKRLQTILTYRGDAKGLVEGSEKNSLKIGRFRFTQCGNCQEGCALMQVYSVFDAAVVVHSPIGCFGGIVQQYQNVSKVAQIRGNRKFSHHAICTNIQESDTIYGGVEKLRNSVRDAFERYNPKVIYITTSCASGIIGDDVQAVSEEMSDELGIPVFAVECEGFKSRIWSTGFDASFNAVLNTALKPPKKKQEDLVNIFNFNSGEATFTPLLKTIGLRPNFLIRTRTFDELSEMSEAACSATICETLSTFVADKLEELYGIPQVQAPAPFGIMWTDRWLRAVAALTNKHSIVEGAIRKEHERIEKVLNEFREEFKGKKAYVFAGDAFAHNIASVVHDLGLEVVGVTTYHHDKKYDNPELNTAKFLVQTAGNIPNFTVCNKQPYQVLKFLKQLKPDILFVRHGGLAVLGNKLGIPAIMEGDSDQSVGYDGVLEMGRRIRSAFRSQKLYKTFAEHTNFPYSDWWLSENTDPFHFVEK